MVSWVLSNAADHVKRDLDSDTDKQALRERQLRRRGVFERWKSARGVTR